MTYKTGVIAWVEYNDDDITVDIGFENGDEVTLLLVNIRHPSTE